MMTTKYILSYLCALFFCLVGFSASAESVADGFKINNGLVKPEVTDRALANRKMYGILEPNYTGTVESTLRVGDYRAATRIELRQNYMDGTGGQSWPTLWQPDSFCETLLEKPVALADAPNAWILRASNAAKMPETACDTARQLGSVAGVKHIIVRHDPAATGIGFTVEIFGYFSEQPLARGTLRQGKAVLETPDRAIFNEASLATSQNLAAYPALITAEVTDRHGIVHPLSVHRVTFIGQKLPILNVYDHYSGCVFERTDPAPGADTAARFRLDYSLGYMTVKHQCDDKKALKTRILSDTLKGGAADMAWVGDMVFDRQSDGSYALTIEGKDLFLSFSDKPKPAPIARGAARLTGKGPLYVDHMPADGLRDIKEYFLVRNDGLYRIGEHWHDYKKGLAAYVMETTDMNSLFKKGDAIARVSWYALEQEMSLAWYERTKSGKCSDKVSNSTSYRFATTAPGVRSGQASQSKSSQRFCVAPVIRLDTCEELRCLQWDDTMTYPNPASYLTADESKARELWAKITKWTRASTGLQHDPSTFSETITTRSDNSPYPFGECGLEGCEAKRNREQLENTLIDMWND